MNQYEESMTVPANVGPAVPEMDSFSAAMIADGEFSMTPFEENEENYVLAYQNLIDTGMAWSLQGRIGREAMRLIERGDCHHLSNTKGDEHA